MTPCSRRTVLKATGAAALGFPYIVPAHVLGRGGRIAPSEKIVMGAIGVGSMGGGHLRSFLNYDEVQVVGVCDLRKTFRQRGKQRVDERYGDEGCATYRDFRALLARADIDAVFIATPEHWHGLIGIEAAKQRKHMYLEKPIDVHVAAALALRRAVHRYGVVFQFGTQQRSSQQFRYACELVRNEAIGKLQTVVVGSLPSISYPLEPLEPEPEPDAFDYDMWLGPAPRQPYSFQRCASRAEGSVGVWMHIYDYGLGGLAGAWGVHHIDIAQWGSGMDLTGPVSIQGRGEIPSDGLADTPISWHVEHEYANGLTMIHLDHRQAARIYEPLTSRMLTHTGCGILFMGSEGWVVVSRAGIDASPKSLLKTVFKAGDIRLPVSDDHRQNFLDCVRSGAQTMSPIDGAVRTDTVCHLDDIAIRLGRKLTWDLDRERFVGGDTANRMLTRSLRSPWHL